MPAVIPATMPTVSTVALALLLFHVPPTVADDNVMAAPTATELLPLMVIPEGVGVTVTDAVAAPQDVE